MSSLYLSLYLFIINKNKKVNKSVFFTLSTPFILHSLKDTDVVFSSLSVHVTLGQVTVKTCGSTLGRPTHKHLYKVLGSRDRPNRVG
jgi:hypothetical protein